MRSAKIKHDLFPEPMEKTENDKVSQANGDGLNEKKILLSVRPGEVPIV